MAGKLKFAEIPMWMTLEDIEDIILLAKKGNSIIAYTIVIPF